MPDQTYAELLAERDLWRDKYYKLSELAHQTIQMCWEMKDQIEEELK